MFHELQNVIEEGYLYLVNSSVLSYVNDLFIQ